MVNVERLYEIAKPRDKKAHRKFMLWYRFRWLIKIWQNIILVLKRGYKNK